MTMAFGVAERFTRELSTSGGATARDPLESSISVSGSMGRNMVQKVRTPGVGGATGHGFPSPVS
jgi:hypothetical protein